MPAFSNLDEYVKLRTWRYGGPFGDFLMRHLDVIKSLIAQEHLVAVPAEHLPVHFMDDAVVDVGAVDVAMTKDVRAKLRPRPFPGGMKIPHLHFQGEVFVLNEKQWQKLTSTIINEFQAKLQQTHSVSFEQLMQLSEAIDPLP